MVGWNTSDVITSDDRCTARNTRERESERDGEREREREKERERKRERERENLNPTITNNQDGSQLSQLS